MYNITKKRDMFSEQAEYFYLMQHYFGKAKESGLFNSFISWLYRIFSNYGQSTLRPIISLISVWVVFALLYEKDWLLSVQQIVKPYSILFQESKELCKWQLFLGTLESTAAIALIALFLIALRWRFRKA